MSQFLCRVCVVVSLVLLGGNSYGGNNGLRVSVKDGLISITSTKSTLPEIIALLSQKLDMKIKVYGGTETTVVPCAIRNAALADALQILLPEWDYISLSRSTRSANVWLKSSYDEVPQNGADRIPANCQKSTSGPSLTTNENGQSAEDPVAIEEEIVVDMPDNLSFEEGESPPSQDEVVYDVPIYEESDTEPLKKSTSPPNKRAGSRSNLRLW